MHGFVFLDGPGERQEVDGSPVSALRPSPTIRSVAAGKQRSGPVKSRIL